MYIYNISDIFMYGIATGIGISLLAGFASKLHGYIASKTKSKK